VGESKNAYRLHLRKSEGKGQLERRGHRWNDNTNTDLKKYDEMPWKINLAADGEI
jgi:hypothetical protein